VVQSSVLPFSEIWRTGPGPGLPKKGVQDQTGLHLKTLVVAMTRVVIMVVVAVVVVIHWQAVVHVHAEVDHGVAAVLR